MARILVIEDEKDLQHVLLYNLKEAGYDALAVGRGREGLKTAREWGPDLVLLDLMLPDLPGTEVCRALRAEASLKGTRIVILTAKREEIDRIIGFELGADDYVVKPFSVRELLLRIRAVLRRAAEPEDPEARIEFGRLRVDREAHRTWVDGEEVVLTTLEFRLLERLYDRRNKLQTREALLDEVWGIEADVTTRTVDAHVMRLREKLGPAAPYIVTIRGAGYRFAETPEEAGD